MAQIQSSAAEMLAQPAGFGLISGPGTGTSDSIPAALSDGEVVIPAEDVRAFGAAQIMSMIKKGGKDLPKPKVQSGRVHAATGGLIEDPGAVSRIGNSYSGGNVSGPIAINGAQPGGTFSSIGAGPVSAAAQLAQPVAPKPGTPAAPWNPASGVGRPNALGSLADTNAQIASIRSSYMPAAAAPAQAPAAAPAASVLARPPAPLTFGAFGGPAQAAPAPAPVAAPAAAPQAPPPAPTGYADRNDAFNAGANARSAMARQPRLGYAEGGLVREEDLRRLAQTQAQAAATDVMGRRPPINMGMADVVRPAGLPGPQPVLAAQPQLAAPSARAALAAPPAAATPAAASGRNGRLAGWAAPGAALAGIAGAAQSFDDISSGHRDQFQRNMGVETPIGSVAADAARVLSNVGDAATFGLAGRTGRGIASAVGSGSFADGFAGPADGSVPPPVAAPPAARPPAAAPAQPSAVMAAVPTPLPASEAVSQEPQRAGGMAGTVSGVSSADRIGQLQRDGQHLQDLGSIQRRIDANNGQAPGMVAIDGAGADADRRARFNETANLNNALARGSWSPRRGYQGDDVAVGAALSQIKTRADGDANAQQQRGLDARARMTDLRQQQANQVDQQRLGLDGQRLVLDANRDDRAATAAATEQRAGARLAQLQEQVVSGTPEQRTAATQAIAALNGREVSGNQPPAGYRRTVDGNLEAIKGGPADPAVRGSRAPLNDTQSKALQFGTRMQTSGQLLDGLAASGVDQPGLLKRSADAIGLGAAANWTQSPEQQQVEQAQRDFINAALRRESGAAIADSEFKNARAQYFPQVGDSPAVIDQKRNNRLIATRGILAEVPDSEARVAQVRGVAPPVGTLDSGFTFLGGDPANPSSWRKGQ